MRFARSVSAAFVLAFLFAGSTAAQITQGRLTGLVTDAQGAVLPGVTVTVTSPALIGTQSTVTQADGKYLFPALPTGTYKLVVRAWPDSRKLTRENISWSSRPDDLGRRAAADRRRSQRASPSPAPRRWST